MNKRLQLPGKFAVVKDLVLSVLAYALPAVTLTFFIQPMMARVVTDDQYGRFLTLLGVIRLLVGVFITSLANLRMLRDKEYQNEGVTGDFNRQLVLSMSLSTLILCGALVFYKSTDPWEYILCIITMLLIMAHDYYSVYYRVVIQYNKLVWDNVCIVVGYAVGLVIYMFCPIWQIVMISGYVFGMVYVLLTSPYYKETLKKTHLHKNTARQHTQIGASLLLKDSINYCDRMLIYPVLGGAQVSVYNAASVVGKAIQLVSAPAQRVILSYIVRQDALDKRNVKKLLLLGIPGFVVAYIGLYFAGQILLPIMYPQYAAAASNILWIILLSVLLNTFAGLLNTILLRFDKMSIQIAIPAARLVCYLGSTLLLVSPLGLMGFCYGFLASSLVFVGYALIRLLLVCNKPNTDKE